MKISVKAKPKSKKEFVKRMSVSSYIVSVTEPAEKVKLMLQLLKL